MNDCDETMKGIADKEKSQKLTETLSTNNIPYDLDVKLAADLEQSSGHCRYTSRGYVNQVMTAEFQADTLIMMR